MIVCDITTAFTCIYEYCNMTVLCWGEMQLINPKYHIVYMIYDIINRKEKDNDMS